MGRHCGAARAENLGHACQNSSSRTGRRIARFPSDATRPGQTDLGRECYPGANTVRENCMCVCVCVLCFATSPAEEREGVTLQTAAVTDRVAFSLLVPVIPPECGAAQRVRSSCAAQGEAASVRTSRNELARPISACLQRPVGTSPCGRPGKARTERESPSAVSLRLHAAPRCASADLRVRRCRRGGGAVRLRRPGDYARASWPGLTGDVGRGSAAFSLLALHRRYASTPTD